MNRVAQSCAVWLAAGYSQQEVAKMHGVSKQYVSQLLDDPEMQARVEELAGNYLAGVEELLLHGQRKAAAKLVQLLDATGENGRPLHTIQMQAALRLLDQAGKMGPVVKRSEQSVAGKITHHDAPKVEESLRRALMEPSVRSAILASGGKLALPSGEIIDVETIIEPESNTVQEIEPS